MKLRHIALATLVLCGGPAFAVAPDLPSGAQAKLYVGGSSAIAPVLAGIFTQNCTGAGNLTIFSSKAGSGAFTGDGANGASHNVYYCGSVTGSDFGAAYVGKSVAVWKRDAGGSGIGVYPVADGAAGIVGMLDTSACDDIAGGVALCSAVTNVQIDAGISDLETTAFNSSVNRPPAFSSHANVTAAQFESTQPVAAVVFGIIANTRLFNQLAADQSTTTPSISSSMVNSLFSPGYVDSGLGWSPITGANAGNQINICYRGIGSGTRASHQIFFLQLPNNKLTSLFEVPTNNTAGAVKGGNTPGAIFISEESSAGNVTACVEAAEAGGGYAIGFTSADRDLTANNAKFLYLDNQNPNRVAAKDGKYQNVFEAFYNTNKIVRYDGNGTTQPHSNTAFYNSLVFAKAFRDAFKKPSNINAIPAGPKNGVMAVPGSCAAKPDPDEAVCSNVSRGGDSRTPLLFVR